MSKADVSGVRFHSQFEDKLVISFGALGMTVTEIVIIRGIK